MILVLLYMILFLYIIILLIKLVSLPKIPTWNTITIPEDKLSETAKMCTKDEDCGLQEKCVLLFDNHFNCIRTSAPFCNPNTSEEILTPLHKELILKCECKYPHFITQVSEGKNCDVDVACGVHGHLQDITLNPITHGTCVCDKGYVAGRDSNGPFCKIETDIDREKCYPFPFNERTYSCDCDHYHVDSESEEAKQIFHPRYLEQFKDHKKCLRKPCNFNVINGKTLVHGRLTENGCMCDPRYGHFGVRLNVTNYLNTNAHYNACASVLEDEPATSNVECEVFCFFYIHEKPFCFIIFKNLKNQVKPFENYESVTISDPWPHNAFQDILKNQNFLLYRKRCTGKYSFYCYEDDRIRNLRVNCSNLSVIKSHNEKSNFYNKMYLYPICLHTGRLPQYHGHYVLNPSMMKLGGYEDLLRANGIVIKNKTIGWTVGFRDCNFWYYNYHSVPSVSYDYDELYHTNIYFIQPRM